MTKKMQALTGFLALLSLTLACGLPSAGGGDPADQVATVVASTLEALTPAGPGEATSEPGSSSSILPHALYYLRSDGAGVPQVYRLDRDGETETQLTFEPGQVEFYDVSPADGSIAYVSNNQLLLIQPDGSGRRVLVDGGGVDENNPFLVKINNPVFSPDGRTLAYGHQGLSLYDLPTGDVDLVLENQWNEVGGGLSIPQELYWPEQFSSDGEKLIVTLGYYEGASTAVYYPETGALTRLSGGEGSIICCGDYHLSADGSVLYAASPHMGMFRAGLWRVDIAGGTIATLLSSDFDSNPAEVADNPFLAPDGQLYYFFASVPNPDGFVDRAPLQLVRSAPDGVTGRATVRPETFSNMWEALWAPDASFVIVTVSNEEFQGREARLIYTDGRPITVLLPFAQRLKWGP